VGDQRSEGTAGTVSIDTDRLETSDSLGYEFPVIRDVDLR